MAKKWWIFTFMLLVPLKWVWICLYSSPRDINLKKTTPTCPTMIRLRRAWRGWRRGTFLEPYVSSRARFRESQKTSWSEPHMYKPDIQKTIIHLVSRDSNSVLFSCLSLWNADCVWRYCRLGNIWAPARRRTSKSLLLSAPSAGEKYNCSLTVHINSILLTSLTNMIY